MKKNDLQAVWQIFADICEIPRPSGKEQKIRQFLVNFANKHGIKVIESQGNVIMSKPATKGKEDRPEVLLQAHMDMVCVKRSGLKHDFSKDPIVTYEKDGYLSAEGTTLGADNGIGLACGLAIMISKDVAHGPLKLLMTREEETVMGGASSLSPADINPQLDEKYLSTERQDVEHLDAGHQDVEHPDAGHPDAGHPDVGHLINLDNDDDKVLCLGCAGGVADRAVLAIKRQKLEKDYVALMLTIDGLKGGHSALDIGKSRANAIKLMGYVLDKLSSEFHLKLIDINGGSFDNAIPISCKSTIAIKPKEADNVKKKVKRLASSIKDEFKDSEDISIMNLMVEQIIDKETSQNKTLFAFNEFEQQQLINAIQAIFSGLLKKDVSVTDAIQTSSNLAVIKTYKDKVIFDILSRSSSRNGLQRVLGMSRAVFKLIGANCTTQSSFEGWKTDLNSPLISLALKTYKELFNKEMTVELTHGGLECGTIISKVPSIKHAIAIGPHILDEHTEFEKVEIASVDRFYRFLSKLLSEI